MLRVLATLIGSGQVMSLINQQRVTDHVLGEDTVKVTLVTWSLPPSWTSPSEVIISFWGYRWGITHSSPTPLHPGNMLLLLPVSPTGSGAPHDTWDQADLTHLGNARESQDLGT